MADYPEIQGKVPHSWPEVYIALALEKYRIKFDYQYALFQTPGVRGSIIVDFVLHNPFAQPLEVYGEHWHTGKLSADDRLKLQLTQKHFKREVLIVWDYECDDQDKANQWVRGHVA